MLAQAHRAAFISSLMCEREMLGGATRALKSGRVTGRARGHGGEPLPLPGIAEHLPTEFVVVPTPQRGCSALASP